MGYIRELRKDRYCCRSGRIAWTGAHGDEVYNAIAVYEAVQVQGIPIINDDEGLELRYFSLDEPIDNLNSNSYKILKQAGYIRKW